MTPANLKAPFAESCCDGGQCNPVESAQPCGCDPGYTKNGKLIGWLCTRHTVEKEQEWLKSQSQSQTPDT